MFEWIIESPFKNLSAAVLMVKRGDDPIRKHRGQVTRYHYLFLAKKLIRWHAFPFPNLSQILVFHWWARVSHFSAVAL